MSPKFPHKFKIEDKGTERVFVIERVSARDSWKLFQSYQGMIRNFYNSYETNTITDDGSVDLTFVILSYIKEEVGNDKAKQLFPIDENTFPFPSKMPFELAKVFVEVIFGDFLEESAENQLGFVPAVELMPTLLKEIENDSQTPPQT